MRLKRPDPKRPRREVPGRPCLRVVGRHVNASDGQPPSCRRMRSLPWKPWSRSNHRTARWPDRPPGSASSRGREALPGNGRVPLVALHRLDPGRESVPQPANDTTSTSSRLMARPEASRYACRADAHDGSQRIIFELRFIFERMKPEGLSRARESQRPGLPHPHSRPRSGFRYVAYRPRSAAARERRHRSRREGIDMEALGGSAAGPFGRDWVAGGG